MAASIHHEIPARMWIAAILISMPSFLFGYVTAALNACLVTGDGDDASKCFNNNDDGSPSCPPGTLYNDINLSTTDAQLATALAVAGAWIGSLVGSKPSEFYGRRATLLLNNLFFIAGGILTASSIKELLFVGRLIAGFGVGLESVVVPVLLSEVARAETRGTITTIHQLMITIGIFFVSLCGYGFVSYVPHGWVYVQAGYAIPAVIMIVGAKFIPESPKWLVANNRMAEAEYALRLVRPSEADISAELSELQLENKSNHTSEATWGEVFACRQAMIIGCGLMFFTAMTGINTVIFYSATIFSFAGFDEAILATAAVGLVNVISTILATYLVDKMGRKSLLLQGVYCMMFALLLLSIILISANGDTAAQGAVAVVATLIFVYGFAVGLGAVSWVVMSEVMSTRLRSKAFGLFVSINWGANLLIGLLTLTAIDGLGGVKSSMNDDETGDARKTGVAYMYFIFAGICLCCLVFLYSYVPETKGKKPEDFLDTTHNPLYDKYDAEVALAATNSTSSSVGQRKTGEKDLIEPLTKGGDSTSNPLAHVDISTRA